ncbi:hypothetical protein JTE90_004195 [Oedothorax gibbosus]|uniref:Uncharacterized protein n=1 Tax=Oedothorax gibbosus TaxID=931172 RepID=A0AAV6V4Q6_9ARAC|nr:hypothetical protein JTE90_004195 [Oedothorax gibbosus]
MWALWRLPTLADNYRIISKRLFALSDDEAAKLGVQKVSRKGENPEVLLLPMQNGSWVGRVLELCVTHVRFSYLPLRQTGTIEASGLPLFCWTLDEIASRYE